jgi:hypothetical protein
MGKRTKTVKNKPNNGELAMTKLFPVTLIVLDMLAGIVYLCAGDYRRAIYWWFAAGLTATVTF